MKGSNFDEEKKNKMMIGKLEEETHHSILLIITHSLTVMALSNRSYATMKSLVKRIFPLSFDNPTCISKNNKGNVMRVLIFPC